MQKDLARHQHLIAIVFGDGAYKGAAVGPPPRYADHNRHFSLRDFDFHNSILTSPLTFLGDTRSLLRVSRIQGMNQLVGKSALRVDRAEIGGIGIAKDDDTVAFIWGA